MMLITSSWYVWELMWKSTKVWKVISRFALKSMQIQRKKKQEANSPSHAHLFRTELTLNPSGFSLLWFEPRLGHMWESQVLLTDGQVFFPQVLGFSLTFDEWPARYKWNIRKKGIKTQIKKKRDGPVSLTWLPNKFRVNWPYGSREVVQYNI